MSILVTGASGFLGQAVVERLLAHGDFRLRCFVRPTSDTSGLDRLRDRYPHAQLDYIVGNLASPQDAIRAVEDVETIYHLAAGMRGLPATIFADTVVASNHLLEATGDQKRRVVLVSSLGVYGTSFLETGCLIGENTLVDPHPEKRNAYFHAKIWQERLFQEQAQTGKLDLVVLRVGVLYGNGIGNRAFPSRMGITIGNMLLMVGGGNRLPLSHVVNCAEAIVLAGRSLSASGQIYNLLDDDLPTGREYLRGYKHQVKNVPTISLPFSIIMWLSRMLERYHVRTRGQIPAILTPYESSAMWKGHQFDNRRIKQLGWRQIVSTPEAMRETFAFLRDSLNGNNQ
jgi:nucleoside-diphosphate-sugar epimerase